MNRGTRATARRAAKATASTLGVLVGLAGIEHGYFEMLQGSRRPEGVMIDAIGPGQRFWEYGTETALTIVPSFLWSGALAMVLGLLVVIWACAFVHRRSGAVVLLGLAVSLFLVGGGFAPIFLTILAFIAATRIRSPVVRDLKRRPTGFRYLLSRIWPGSLGAAVVLFVVAVEIAIFGNPLLSILGAEGTYAVQFWLGTTMLLLSILSVPAAFAHDDWKLSIPAGPQ